MKKSKKGITPRHRAGPGSRRVGRRGRDCPPTQGSEIECG